MMHDLWWLYVWQSWCGYVGHDWDGWHCRTCKAERH